VRLPHEDLTAVARVAKAVTRAGEKEGGQTIYSGTIDKEASRALIPEGQRNVAQGGTAKFWVGADGAVTKYRIDVRIQGRIGNAEVDGTVTRTVTLSGAGATKVEVPEAARKALQE
jgi:hypothetical protein